MDEFLAARSRERRKNVRRHARRLEESYGDGLKIRFFASPADLDGLYEACVRVHRTSYQHALGVGFSSDERQRRLTELSMRKGWYLAGVLFLRGEPGGEGHPASTADAWGLESGQAFLERGTSGVRASRVLIPPT